MSEHHDHVYGQDLPKAGEARTHWVIALTAVMMAVEIAAGLAFGSMALLADGLHMASHAAALSIAAFAYGYARRRARDPSFSFGTGKVNSLAGYTSAVILVMFALLMVWESVERMFAPVPIDFDDAIFVAIAGLVVNAVSALILGRQDHGHDHGHAHEREHEHEGPHEDQNLRAAYLHVIADALTSVLAIGALLGGRFLNAVWLDPAMGLVGAALVSKWAWGLVRDTSAVLLDRQASESQLDTVRAAIAAECEGEVTDLHLWALAPGRYALIASVETGCPPSPSRLEALLPADLQVVHATFEVNASSPREVDTVPRDGLDLPRG